MWLKSILPFIIPRPLTNPLVPQLRSLNNNPNLLVISSRSFAARKGTRSKRAAKKVKKEEVKQPFLFESVRKALEQPFKSQRPFDDSHYPLPVDDVFLIWKFRSLTWPFAQAVGHFKDLYDSTMYNEPNAPLILRVNVDLKYPGRATKCQDGWRSVIEMTAPFHIEGMIRPTVLAFCIEDVDYISNVLKSGADVAGGKEIIKAIQEGEINPKDFEYTVAHPSVVPDLASIRGLIKRTFPTVKNKTISTDLDVEVKRLKSGIKVKLEKSDREPDFGWFETPIGTLNMTNEQLESNFVSILRDTVPRRVPGKEPQDFVISCVLSVQHEGRPREQFKVELGPYLEEFKKSASSKKKKEQEEDVEIREEPTPSPAEQQEQKAAAAPS